MSQLDDIHDKQDRLQAAIERVEEDMPNQVGMFAAWLSESVDENAVRTLTYGRYGALCGTEEPSSVAEALRMSAPDCSAAVRAKGMLALWDEFIAAHKQWIQDQAEKSL